MSKLFYPRLAVDNIKKNRKTYFPYMITCIITAAMFYILCSLSANEGIKALMGADAIILILNLGQWVVGIFALIFLFYANSFLMKRRKKEFGLFHILGMEKKHLSRVIMMETLYIWVIALVVGLIIGVILDKLMYLILLQILDAKVSLGFYVSLHGIVLTALLFTVIFLTIFIYSVLQIRRSKPIELLKGGNTGEKEPKTKWIMTFLGLLCLGGGYYISLAVEEPLQAIFFFFIAVILVIIGTYFLFIAGSIAGLKLLRKQKGYYYKANHFINVSSMLYRMKQNAVGLASICILSTMVLVMVSSTASLIVGVEDSIHSQFPYNFIVTAINSNQEQEEQMKERIDEILAENDTQAEDKIGFHYLAFAMKQEEDVFFADQNNMGLDMEGVSELTIVTLDEYNHMTGKSIVLAQNQVLVYGNREEYGFENITLFQKNYEVKDKLKEFPGRGIVVSPAVNGYFIVVESVEEQALFQQQMESYGEYASAMHFCYAFDLAETNQVQMDIHKQLAEQQKDNFGVGSMADKNGFAVEGQADTVRFAMSLYGGLFFLGIFLGTLFIMAAVLIIYYKQISEGYEDKERYEIMQKVGMSQDEVKRSIRSQIITVFFLPLVAAGVHIIFAFPIIKSILRVLYLTNVNLFITCTVICYIIFAVAYAMIFMITSRSYYRIVKR